MADEIVVKGGVLQLEPIVPTQPSILTSIHSIAELKSGPLAKSEGEEVVVESDIEKSLESYTTQYSTSTFPVSPGTLEFKKIEDIQNLSTLTKKDGVPVVIKSTQGVISMKVLIGQEAKDNNGNSDTVKEYSLKFSIKSAGQTLSKTK